MADGIFKDISRLILSKQSIVLLHTWEEQRVSKILELIASKQFSKPLNVFYWSLSEGVIHKGEPVKIKDRHLISALEFLEFALKINGNGIFIAKDLDAVWETDIKVQRKLKDIYDAFKDNYKTLFLVSSKKEVPYDLSKEISFFEFPFPDYKEVKHVFEGVIEEVKKKKNVKVSLTHDDIEAFIRATLGLTLDEVRRAYNRAFMDETHIKRDLISNVLNEKKFLIDKTPGLVYVTDVMSLETIGGLEKLKEWLMQRIKCFSPEAEKYKIVAPKGLLITGIAGCGKSFIVKGIAGLWDMPLIRLDMNQMYSAGSSPGQNFENALKTVEAISPALLWIDEIEKAIGEGNQGDEASRIFGAFLTWMQEKSLPVFVVATANNITLLPPEMLRKGRFDEIFFVDLPTAAERESIFRLHMEKRNLNPSEYDLLSLRASTEGFSGSEIEQIVVSAVFRAFVRNEKAQQDDFFQCISQTIPLSVTMSNDIKELKRWASQRAIFAGKNSAENEVS